jgi:hypothetical protein
MEVEVRKNSPHVDKLYWESVWTLPGVAIAPVVDEDYWVARVRLHRKQHLNLFPKFDTLGIGFAQEDADWNLNLPYKVEAEKICEHIWDNRKHEEITKQQVIQAIEALQEVARKIDRGEVWT